MTTARRAPSRAAARLATVALATVGLACVGLAASASGPAVARVSAVRTARTAHPARTAQPQLPRLQPLPGEWWFSAWDIRTRVWPLSRGAGVIVALLDSGVQASVPDLRGAVVPGGDTTGAGTNGETDDNYSESGHGTAMASLIAGQGPGTGIVGIAPAAKIMPVRVGGLHGVPAGGTPQTVAAGIRFAVDHGAKVINMSLGDQISVPVGCEPVEQAAVAYALRHNVVLVASAGNLGNTGNPPEEPASCQGVLAVGAVNPNLTLWAESERQPYIAVTAPGNEIGWSGSNGRYYPDGYGTSQAAAFTSGEAVLIRSRYPSMPWQQVVQRIVDTALPKGGPVPNDRFGYGIIRISNALDTAHFKVPAGAPNPVYAAYASWLASQPTGSSAPRPGPSGSTARPAAARASSGGSPALAIGLGAAVAVLVGAALLLAARARRRA